MKYKANNRKISKKFTNPDFVLLKINKIYKPLTSQMKGGKRTHKSPVAGTKEGGIITDPADVVRVRTRADVANSFVLTHWTT